MVIGQKTKEVPTISGMQSAAVQHRLVLVFSSLLLLGWITESSLFFPPYTQKVHCYFNL